MGEKMSLAQVRDQIAAVATEDDYMLQGWIAAIDAHLAQPAQAVDRAERAEALLREVVAAHTGENIEGCDMSDADVARITAHLSENNRG